MAKMGTGTGLRKIPLSQIVITGNIRVDYAEIDELAQSIKTLGQLEPVLVKPLEPDADGERFELTAGHRRYLAHKKLNEAGEGFTTIDSIVTTGDKTTIQMVENLQRSDLTAAERESGIYQMCKNGLTQKEVAARLSKPVEFVSRNVSAYKIRAAAGEAGIDTTLLATGTLNEIQAAKPADYPALVTEIIQSGGTNGAARAVMKNYRVAHGKPANPKDKKPGASDTGGVSDPLGLHPSPVTDPIVEELSADDLGIDTSIDIDTTAKPAQKKEPKKAAPSMSLDDFDPPHKQVDFNDVCLLIMGYAKKNEEVVKACKVTTCDRCINQCVFYNRLEIIKDILALLHTEL